MARTKGSKNKPKQEKLNQDNSKYKPDNGFKMSSLQSEIPREVSISIPPFPVTSFAHPTVQTVTVQSKPDVQNPVESVQPQYAIEDSAFHLQFKNEATGQSHTVEDSVLKDVLWEAQSLNEEKLTEFKDRSALQLAQMVRQGANGSFILGDRHVFKMSVELILEAILLTAR